LREAPAATASFHTFGQNSIQMTISFWIDTSQTDPLTAKDTGLKAVNSAFQSAGVQFPQPVPVVSA
jgi:small-conductance mechanosensitive channel